MTKLKIEKEDPYKIWTEQEEIGLEKRTFYRIRQQHWLWKSQNVIKQEGSNDINDEGNADGGQLPNLRQLLTPCIEKSRDMDEDDDGNCHGRGS